MKNQLYSTSTILALFTAFITISCTKSIPYKEIPPNQKQDEVNKDLLDLQAEYLYSSSMMNASRTSSEAFPYSAGDNKRVKIQLTEKTLKIIEMERDQRFADNTANNKLVLEIPVEHVDYQCAKDKFGECTNTEEVKNDVKWFEKSKVKIKFEAAKTGGIDLLPIASDFDFCHKEVSSELKNYSIDKDSLNFDIERTYKAFCDPLDQTQISDNTVTAVFHYSMVKASSILTPGFKTISYPNFDERTFGFFSTERRPIGVDNNKTESNLVRIMNHWHPDRSEILYLLSDEFNKPANRLVKELTEKTIANLNDGLAEAGVKFRIRLEMANGRSLGDIRNSSIVLIEDPVASSVIGYGPQVEDPITGEIISARTIMFLGTIKTYIKDRYNEIVELKKQDDLKSRPATKLKVSLNQIGRIEFAKNLLGKVKSEDNNNNNNNNENQNDQNNVDKPEDTEDVGQLDESDGRSIPAKSSASKKPVKKFNFDIQKLKEAKNQLTDYSKLTNKTYSGEDLKSQLKYMHEVKNCAFSLESNFNETSISEKLKEKFSSDAKPWAQLSDTEREKVIEIILPEIWIPTLIHELGHNMGLRHNFQGSEDKENFYTKEEHLARGLDHTSPFSSVMEYGDDLLALPVLGKYDIAALKFGYRREVQTSKGNYVSIDDSLGKMKTQKNLPELKDFKYCTDENTGAGAGCKRFDLGTTYTEIVQNFINDYEAAYKLRNFRNDRVDFSAAEEHLYAARMRSRFMELRLIFESYETLKNTYDLPDDDPIFKLKPGDKDYEMFSWVIDLKNAVVLSGKFFSSVITMPDYSCVISTVATEKNPSEEVVNILSLKTLDPSSESCFDISSDLQRRLTKNNLKIVGEAGKFINSFKSKTSENSYSDQIDVRGVWTDKLMATKMLFDRALYSSTFDKYLDNYADIKDLTESLTDLTQKLALNSIDGNVEVRAQDGSKQSVNLSYDMFDSMQIKRLFVTKFGGGRVYDVSKFLGVPSRDFYLTESLLPLISEQMNSDANRDSGFAFSESLKVTKFNRISSSNLNEKEFKKLKVKNDLYYASEENLVARRAMELIEANQALSKLPRAKLIEIFQARDKNPKAEPDVSASVDEIAVWLLPNNDIFGFLIGALESEEFYQKIVTILPN